MTLLAGDAVRMAAGHDMKLTLLEAGVRHRLRERRIDVADKEIDLVALDQLEGFLNRGGSVTAGRIFDQELDLAAQNSTLGVDLLDGELRADQFVLAERGESAGQRIVEPDFYRLVSERFYDEGARNLHGAERQTGLQYCSPLYRPAATILGHRVSPFAVFLGFLLKVGHLYKWLPHSNKRKCHYITNQDVKGNEKVSNMRVGISALSIT